MPFPRDPPSEPRGRRPAAPAIDEAALIAACQRGDRAAMGRLYTLYSRRVYSLVVRIAGQSSADEVSQEVFLKIFKGLQRFRGDSQLGTWIYRLAVNAALTYVTRRPRELPLDDHVAEPRAVDPPSSDPALRARIERAMAALPAGYRAVLVLHDVEGLNHEEIAEVLGCRVGTSKSQLHKARQRMRELLGPMD
ncbi:MAG TPA: sigma-70 family RNA polymerase sigma factor [Polyangia bacterium]